MLLKRPNNKSSMGQYWKVIWEYHKDTLPTRTFANPSDNTIHKIIIDGGNGQVLSTSVDRSLESLFGHSRHAGFGHWKGHQGIFGEL